MSVPCDPEPHEEEQDIVLRLADILPRVPAHLLKPGSHDAMSCVRFTVEELAEKIAHGRVSVPLARLASACPEVFRDSESFPADQEIQLPLQKLLEQVGLVAPKPPAANGIPGDQVAQARAQASRIIETANPPPDPEAHEAPGISKAISTARQFFGLFGRFKPSPEPTPSKEPPKISPRESKPVPEEKQPVPSTSEKAPEPTPPPAVPANSISLRVLPIFRLLPGDVLVQNRIPPQAQDTRVVIPLSVIDPQLIGGHVEIPLEDFIKALPGELRPIINPVPKAQVWIPLDEIFQSLPPDHLFYMPPLGPIPEPAAAPVQPSQSPEPVPPSPESTEPGNPAEPVQELAADPIPDSPSQAITSTTEPPPMNEPSPQVVSADQETKSEPTPPAVETPSPSAEFAPPSSKAPLLTAALPTSAEPPPPTSAPPPSRAPWMRGFQIPAPRLFAGENTPAEVHSEPIPVDPIAPPPPTPEAKRTADFLASQPGIFAAAAFVQGAVFASADFPRKPDLDALRDFMGAFVDRAQESGRRLGWNGVLTIACEQFHITAVVCESHFIVALHHDRVLTSLAHDAVIVAANDLSEAAS